MLLYQTLSQPLIFLIVAIFGLFSSAAFDARNLLFFLCNKNKVVSTILDIVLGIVLGLVLLILTLWLNYGQLRLYLILAYVLGIIAERICFGRLIAKLSKRCYTFFKGKMEKLYDKQRKKKENTNS